MSTFASVYRPRKHAQGLLSREQETKRKRNEDTSDSSDAAIIEDSPDSDDEPSPRAATNGTHPVNKTDPYFVAGLSREASLPPYPFPFAATKSSEDKKVSAEEALASVNPPLYVPKTDHDEHAASLKRKHLDNVTAILHQCMLRGDWQRASRAWGLLMRTEIGGRGIDVRKHGRWGVGAEILIRREQKPRHVSCPDDDDAQPEDCDALPSPAQKAPAGSIEGFRLAREYYERLILQYPHAPRTRDTLNATTFYPALFNTWVYGVQARYRSLRKEASDRRLSTSDTSVSEDVSEHQGDRLSTNLSTISSAELEDAIPIAQRMDELLLSPPYDTSLPLLQLRGMIGLWLADLYAAQTPQRKSCAGDTSITGSPETGLSSYADRLTASRNREKSNDERMKALKLLERAEATDQSAVLGQNSTHAVRNGMSE